jgi:phosphoribosylformylglycinamidine (FGAM) synthase-like enzyme
MEVVKIGGPVYRIGVGGGAASSVEVTFKHVASHLLNLSKNNNNCLCTTDLSIKIQICAK